MSRLYEALQRADLERKTASAPDGFPVVDPSVFSDVVTDAPVISGVDADSSVFSHVVSETPVISEFADPFPPPPPPSDAAGPLEIVAQHPWNLSVSSFPTLADRGENVEQFRSLRSRIFQARYEAPLKTILIASGIPAEGKSFIAANLAMNLARNTVNNILLIDGDLRRPTLHNLLGAPKTPGLTEYLAGAAGWKDILQRDSTRLTPETASAGSISNLTFIPAGDCGDNSSELVANHRIDELIATVSPHFDWILIDSPPVLAVTDAVELSHAADAVLLIARGGHTPYPVTQRTLEAFAKSRILGFVLNDVKEIPRTGYGYYGDYGYNGGPDAANLDK